MAKARKVSTTAKPGPMPWWGDRGAAPHVRYAGVTIEIPAVWVPLTGTKKRKNQETGALEVVDRDGRKVPAWHLEDGGRWQSPDGVYYFDRGAADRACQFFPELLRHHIGEFAGEPFELLDYQRVLLTRPLFGWKSTTTHLRRFRKLFAFIPKGAGKSPWAAGTGLYLTFADGEEAAEVYAMANDRAQARVVHTNAKIMVEKMIEEDPDVGPEFSILKDSIVHHPSRSTYQVLSADANTKHGFRPSGAIFDEFHGQPNRDLYEAIKKSMPKRRQPLMLIVTHAGDDDEGICYEEYDAAKKVVSGTITNEPTFLPVIFEAARDDRWDDPEVWRRVNPGHGITIKSEGIEIEAQEAKNEPRKLNDFLRYHLNRWVNSAEAWMPVDWFDACTHPLAADPALGELACAGGLDMAQKIDLAAFVLTFREPLEASRDAADAAPSVDVVTGDNAQKIRKSMNYRVHAIPFFWIPENTMAEREKEDGVPYSQWVAAGLITATEGDVIDYDRIVEDIDGTIRTRFPRLKGVEIGYDPAFATDIALRLQARGYKLVEVLQNYKYLSEPSYLLEGLVKARRVAHGGHKVLRHHFENATVKRDDAGRLRPHKGRRTRKRIDGVVGSIIALSRLQTIPDQPKRKGRARAFIIGADSVRDAVTGNEVTN